MQRRNQPKAIPPTSSQPLTPTPTNQPVLLCRMIDYDALSLGGPYVQADLPAGGRRLLQKADGYVATIKKGAVTFEGGKATGELPGRLVRGSR